MQTLNLEVHTCKATQATGIKRSVYGYFNRFVIPTWREKEKGWDPKNDGCQVEEATNGQSYDWEDEEAVWWWVLAGDWCSQGSCDQRLHGSLHGSGIGKRRLSMARGDYSTLSVIKVTINRAGGCWHSKFNYHFDISKTINISQTSYSRTAHKRNILFGDKKSPV